MSIFRALAAELFKMFAGDRWLTLTAILVVAGCALAAGAHVLSPTVLPFVLAGGILSALALGVIRGARR